MIKNTHTIGTGVVERSFVDPSPWHRVPNNFEYDPASPGEFVVELFALTLETPCLLFCANYITPSVLNVLPIWFRFYLKSLFIYLTMHNKLFLLNINKEFVLF